MEGAGAEALQGEFRDVDVEGARLGFGEDCDTLPRRHLAESEDGREGVDPLSSILSASIRSSSRSAPANRFAPTFGTARSVPSDVLLRRAGNFRSKRKNLDERSNFVIV